MMLRQNYLMAKQGFLRQGQGPETGPSQLLVQVTGLW